MFYGLVPMLIRRQQEQHQDNREDAVPEEISNLIRTGRAPDDFFYAFGRTRSRLPISSPKPASSPATSLVFSRARTCCALPRQAAFFS
jgi:hypothetical protein